MHVGDWAARGAAYWPDRVAVKDDASGRAFTYRDVDRRSQSVAAWLRGGVAYYAVTERGVSARSGASQSYSSTWKQLDADVEAHLVVTAMPHLAVSMGFIAEVPLKGEFEEQRAEPCQQYTRSESGEMGYFRQLALEHGDENVENRASRNQ